MGRTVPGRSVSRSAGALAALLAALLVSPPAGSESGSRETSAPPVPAPPAAAAIADPMPLCWTPAQLGPAEGERETRKGVKEAHVAPPKAELVPAQPLARELAGSIRSVEITDGRKLIALTFDLCEGSSEVGGYDARIVDYLRANKVKATFFAGGKWMLSHPERASQLLLDPLFEVGNHSWSHANLRRTHGEAVREELSRAEAAYEQVRSALPARQCLKDAPAAVARVPERMRLVRFPYGACDAEALATTAQQGLAAIQWSISTGDPDPHVSASSIAAGVLRRIKPGAIVIAHANGRGVHTFEALPLLVPQLRAEGYDLVTVSELLAAGKPVIAPTCYDHKPGDSDHYGAVMAHAAAGSGAEPGTSAAKSPTVAHPPKAHAVASAGAPAAARMAGKPAAGAAETVPPKSARRPKHQVFDK